MSKSKSKTDKIKSTIKQCILEFYEINYPYPFSPTQAWLELKNTIPKLKLNTVQKNCLRLAEDGLLAKVPRLFGTYRGKPSIFNASNLEEPPVTIHSITLQYEINEEILRLTKEPYTPLLLYTQVDNLKLINDSDNQKPTVDYFHMNENMHKVSVQFNKQSATVHINTSKHPLSEVEFLTFKTWIYGWLAGKGFRVDLCKMKVVKAELSKDYELITISENSILIRDLETKSWLRLYRKYRNLLRLELGTTYEGDRKLHEMFENFGKPAYKIIDKDDEFAIFG